MTRFNRTIVAQLGSAVQAFFLPLAILLPLLGSLAYPLCAQQPMSESVDWGGELRNAAGNPPEWGASTWLSQGVP
ncbi:MAG TPA: hypothetical protein VFE27_11725 [Acidobacteriaceae bacterium]|jgi:hypothetical protein|nr:hypothetical protein [Acidobacteriaceae bacterium]